MFLDELLGQVKLENSENEYKRQLEREKTENWLKTVAGFSNAEGGTLYVGVEDGTRKLLGFPRDKADSERNFFNSRVNEHISPRPTYKIDFLRYENNGRELFVLKIMVSESPVKPIILKYNGVPSIYMRRQGFTNGASYEEIISMSVRSRAAAYDILPSQIPFQKDHFQKLFRFYSEHNDGKLFPDKALRSIGFYDENGQLANGAVLFQDDYSGEKTALQCSVFSGFHKGSERIVSLNRFSGNLTDSVQYALEFVQQRMNHSVIKQAEAHTDLSAYPQRALTEGIINAIAHRDYFLDGTQIQIDMFRDRLEISSPGGFFQGDKIEKTYDLSNIISKRRNELICGVLVCCKVMEAAGTGFDKIAEEYSGADENHRPYVFSASDHFTLVLPDLTYDKGLSDSDYPVLEFVPVANGSEYDASVLSYCYYQARKAGEIAAYLGITDSTYYRKKILDNLVGQGYLIKSKASRAAVYRTNREFARLA